MLFARRLPLAAVTSLCRALRHGLGAGLTLVQVFRQQAERGVRPVRPLAERVLTTLKQGKSLHDALGRENHALPPLFLTMAEVGEESGHLSEVFGVLEKHFTLQDGLRRQFRTQSMMPLIQLGLAFLIVAVVIFILGAVASANPGTPMRGVLGFSGPWGAARFLLFSFGFLALVWLLVKVVGIWARRQPALDALLLKIPVIGSCMEAVTMSRFTTAAHLTLDSGISIDRALALSLSATGSSAFITQTTTVTQALKNGVDLVEALTRARLFSIDFLGVVAVGEESGRVPEVMRQQADYWNEETARRLKTLVRLVSGLVWLSYAGFMVAAILSMAGVYFGSLGI